MEYMKNKLINREIKKLNENEYLENRQYQEFRGKEKIGNTMDIWKMGTIGILWEIEKL